MWEPVKTETVKKKSFFFLKGGCLLEPEIPQNPSNFFFYLIRGQIYTYPSF